MNTKLSKTEESKYEELIYRKVQNQKEIKRLTKEIEDIQKELSDFELVKKRTEVVKEQKANRPSNFSIKAELNKMYNEKFKDSSFSSKEMCVALQEKHPNFGLDRKEVNAALNYDKKMGVIRNLDRGIFEIINEEENINIDNIPF